MPVETPPNPPVERRLPEGLLSQVFGRYRVFVDAWPIVTTLLLLSGAVGIEAHFMLLGVNASEVLTLEEYTIFGALGLVIAFAVAMPKSLCVCISTSMPVTSMSVLIFMYVLNGSRMPNVSQKRSRSAPASLAVRANLSRNSISAREASSALTDT